MDFRDKVAIVTGGASGIGLAVAKGWSARGGHAVVADCDVANGEKAVAAIVAEGGKASFLPCDLRDFAQADALAARVDAEFGRIDLLHNNAFAIWRGPNGHGLLGDVAQENWDHVLQIGLSSPFRLTRAVLPVMKRNGGGAIVNTSSVAALQAQAHVGPYSVAKAGLAHLTRMIAVEYARDGIRCNGVCPGVIDTPLIVGAPLDADFMAGIPLGRLGRPEEIADAVLFLASDRASYITGQLITVDGGLTL